MPKYRFSFERTYSFTEGFERIIDAPSEAEAEAAAANLASEFNKDCPDDISEIESGDASAGGFSALNYFAKPVQAREEVDYTILPDGQLVAHDGD